VPGVLAVGVDHVVIVGAMSFMAAVMAGCGSDGRGMVVVLSEVFQDSAHVSSIP
jgi:hypothetical protein